MRLRRYRTHFLSCIRVSVSSIVAFILAQYFVLPLHGLWVVLTAAVVTQLNIGSSFRAVVEYFVGTLGGAAYAGTVGLIVPHSTEPAQIAVLAVVVAPSAFAAALNPHFRVAPFSAALVLLISGQLGEGPVESAAFRLLEVMLGGAVALIVSVTVFPERAHARAREVAARILDEMASSVPEIFVGLFDAHRETGQRQIQDGAERSITDLQGIIEEIKGERPLPFLSTRDPTSLLRTLLRLRHDCFMVGRMTSCSLPAKLKECVRSDLDYAGTSISLYFRTCALALRSDQPPRPLQPLRGDLDACVLKIIARHRQHLVQLSADRLEEVCALGFALKQLGEGVEELERNIHEWAPSLSSVRAGKSQPSQADGLL